MTPTGSWPRISPGRTGYSPLTMWTSVPQIVVSVTRIRASPGPGRGRSTSSTWNSCGRVEDVGPHRVDRDHVGSPFVQSARPASAYARRGSPAGPCREDGDAGGRSTEAKVTCSGAGAPELDPIVGSARRRCRRRRRRIARAHGRRSRRRACSRPGRSHGWSATGGARPPSGPASAVGRACPPGRPPSRTRRRTSGSAVQHPCSGRRRSEVGNPVRGIEGHEDREVSIRTGDDEPRSSGVDRLPADVRAAEPRRRKDRAPRPTSRSEPPGRTSRPVWIDRPTIIAPRPSTKASSPTWRETAPRPIRISWTNATPRRCDIRICSGMGSHQGRRIHASHVISTVSIAADVPVPGQVDEPRHRRWQDARRSGARTANAGALSVPVARW